VNRRPERIVRIRGKDRVVVVCVAPGMELRGGNVAQLSGEHQERGAAVRIVGHGFNGDGGHV
jgi:hypothetical protein